MKATQVWCLPVTFLFFSIFQLTKAEFKDIKWPKFSQQCQDDAGPPFQDDNPKIKYHDGSPAYAVLPPDGKCPKPMKGACESRPSVKTAYIEGPVDCGNQGWYCRMTRDENFNDYNLKGDYNAGYCNTTEAFEGAGDEDGHCHGSSEDNTYYWWVRDHWHRQYNGHVRCCCGWDSSNEYPDGVTSQRITNRCDYRRLVPKNEDEFMCRDANEGHGLNFEAGCDRKFEDQIGKPIQEDDAQCWEIALFGFVDSDNDDTADGDDNGSDSDDEEEEECIENENDKFFLKKNKKGKVVKKPCKWLAGKNEKKQNKQCKMANSDGGFGPAQEVCPITCKKCTPEEDSEEDDSEESDSDESGSEESDSEEEDSEQEDSE